MDAWNPNQYERFKAERAQPFHDLLAMVDPREDLRVLDLGCGTGELTRHLHRRLGARETIGLESSKEMLRKSEAFPAPGLSFVEGDIREAASLGMFDVVFSNAALHWLPDHARLLSDLKAILNPGGQLVVQVPANHEHVSQTHAVELAGREPYRGWLDGFFRESPVLRPEQYVELLSALDMAQIQALQRVYLHELPSRDSVVEWVRGTTLTAYEERMTPPQYEEFIAEYRESLKPLLSAREPFLFTFKRTFFSARR